MYIIMLGKPGSGKGTVGKILSEKLGLFHLSSGDLFRNYIKEAGELGKEIESYISKGSLVPDELTIKFVEQRLNEDDCKNGVILDGYPRTIPQAEALDKFLNEKGKKVDMAVNLFSTDEEIIDRITSRIVCSNKACGEVFNLKHRIPKQEGICDVCGSKLIQRDDDKIETVKQRLETYQKNTGPLVEYYERKGVLNTEIIKIGEGRDGKVVAKEVVEKIKK